MKRFSFPDAQVCTHTKDEAEMQPRTGPCTSHTSAAKAGFIPRLLESDISMALSRVSMAIPCTEMKRGTLALGLARNRDKFTSQLERLKPLPPFYPSCFGITVRASQHYPLLHTPSQKNTSTTTTTTLCCFLTQPSLTVTHNEFS